MRTSKMPACTQAENCACSTCAALHHSIARPQLATARALVERLYRTELLRPLPHLAVGDLVIPGPTATGCRHGTVGVVIDMELYKPSDAEISRLSSSAGSTTVCSLSSLPRRQQHGVGLQRHSGSRTVCLLADAEQVDVAWDNVSDSACEGNARSSRDAHTLPIEWGWRVVVRWVKGLSLASCTGFHSENTLRRHIEKCWMENTIEDSDYRNHVFAVPTPLRNALDVLHDSPCGSTNLSSSMDWAWSICQSSTPQRLCDVIGATSSEMPDGTHVQCLHPWHPSMPGVSVLCPAVGRRWDVVPFYCSTTTLPAEIASPIPLSGLLFVRVMEASGLAVSSKGWGKIFVQIAFQGECFTSASRGCCPEPVWHHAQLGCDQVRLLDELSQSRWISGAEIPAQPVKTKKCGCQHCWSVKHIFAAAPIKITVWKCILGHVEMIGQASINIRDICTHKSSSTTARTERQFWQSATRNYEFAQQMTNFPTKWNSVARNTSRAAPESSLATAASVAVQNMETLTATGEIVRELRALTSCMAPTPPASRSASQFNPLGVGCVPLSVDHGDSEVPGLLDVWLPLSASENTSSKIRVQFRMWQDKDFATAVSWKDRVQTVLSVACSNGEHALVAMAMQRLSEVRLPEKQHLMRLDGIRASDGLSALDGAALGATNDHYRCVRLLHRQFGNRVLTTSCPWIAGMLEASETTNGGSLAVVPSRTSLHCAVLGGNYLSVRSILTWMLVHAQSQDALGLTAADLALLTGRPKIAALIMGERPFAPSTWQRFWNSCKPSWLDHLQRLLAAAAVRMGLQAHILDLKHVVMSGYADSCDTSSLTAVVPHEPRSMPGTWWRLGPSPNAMRMVADGVPLIHLVAASLQPTSLALLLQLGADIKRPCPTSTKISISTQQGIIHMVSFGEGQSLLESVFSTVCVLAASDQQELVELGPRIFLTVGVLLAFEAPIAEDSVVFQRCFVSLRTCVSLQSRQVFEALLQLADVRAPPEVSKLVPATSLLNPVPARNALSNHSSTPQCTIDPDVQFAMQSAGFNVDLTDVHLLELLEKCRIHQQERHATGSFVHETGNKHVSTYVPAYQPAWRLQVSCESCGMPFSLSTIVSRCKHCNCMPSASIDELWAQVVDKRVDVKLGAARAWVLPGQPVVDIPQSARQREVPEEVLPLISTASDLFSRVSAIVVHRRAEYVVLSPQHVELLRQLEAGSAICALATTTCEAFALQSRMLTEMLHSGGDADFCAAQILERRACAEQRILDLPAVPTEREFCSACLDDVPVALMHAMECQHRFCLACWAAHLVAAMDEHGSRSCTMCPCLATPSCNLLVDDFTWRYVLPRAHLSKYTRNVTLEYLKLKQRCVPCGNPKNCRNVMLWLTAPTVLPVRSDARLSLQQVDAVLAGTEYQSSIVRCSCGFSMCRRCGLGPHEPAPCAAIRGWRQLSSLDSELSAHSLLRLNYKPCPFCGVFVQKAGGCRHMSCGACRREFCWNCGSNWTGYDHRCAIIRPPWPGTETSRLSIQSQLAVGSHMKLSVPKHVLHAELNKLGTAQAIVFQRLVGQLPVSCSGVGPETAVYRTVLAHLRRGVPAQRLSHHTNSASSLRLLDAWQTQFRPQSSSLSNVYYRSYLGRIASAWYVQTFRPDAWPRHLGGVHTPSTTHIAPTGSPSAQLEALQSALAFAVENVVYAPRRILPGTSGYSEENNLASLVPDTLAARMTQIRTDLVAKMFFATAVSHGACTSLICRNSFEQPIFRCLTCANALRKGVNCARCEMDDPTSLSAGQELHLPMNRWAICASCAQCCHTGHDMEFVGMGHAVCACPSGFSAIICGGPCPSHLSEHAQYSKKRCENTLSIRDWCSIAGCRAMLPGMLALAAGTADEAQLGAGLNMAAQNVKVLNTPAADLTETEPTFRLEKVSHLLDAGVNRVSALIALHELLDFQRNAYIAGAFDELAPGTVGLQQRLQEHIEILFSLTDTSFPIGGVDNNRLQHELVLALQVCKNIRLEWAEAPPEDRA